MAKKGTIVLDAGHGGGDGGNDTATSKTLEKTTALAITKEARAALLAAAAKDGHDLTVLMTRDTDVFIEKYDRPRLAEKNGADLFLSIHCNANSKKVAKKDRNRGVEVWVRIVDKTDPNTDPDPLIQTEALHALDFAFATAIHDAVLLAIQQRDAKTKKRGIKDYDWAVLNRHYLGVKARACLLEVEFIDVDEVDDLLNVRPDHDKVRQEIGAAIATALISSLA